jgi:hypothetical protein
VSNYGGYTNYGYVAVYVRVGNDWALENVVKLAGITKGGQGFGKSFAVSGDTLAVSAFREDDAGAVHVFVRNGKNWIEQAKIPAPFTTASFFGWNVVLSGDTLFVSAPLIGAASRGAVYIYVRDAGVWSLRTTLGGDSDGIYFGTSIALSGQTLAIGAANLYVNTQTVVPGHAYFYVGAGDTWDRQAKLSLPYPDDESVLERRVYYGNRVVIDGDTAVVSAGFVYYDPPLGGVAYVYGRTGTEWTLTQVLKPSQSSFLDGFGSAGDNYGLSLRGDRLVASSPGSNAGRGELFMFERSGGIWKETKRFTANDAAPDDRFGTAVTLSNDMMLVAASGAKVITGKAYSFFLGSEGDPCTSGAPCSTGHCVDGVCCDTACGGGDPNDCMACSVKAGGAVDGICGPTKPHVCRPSRGECDVEDSCDGVNVTCPADLVVPNGRACAIGTCSAGACVSTSNVESNRPPPLLPGPDSDTDGSCSCRATRPSGGWGALAMGMLVVSVCGARLRARRRTLVSNEPNTQRGCA